MKSSKTQKLIIFSWPTIEKSPEKFFHGLREYHIGQKLFRTIRFINRTNSRPIGARTSEERYHWKRVEDGVTVSPPKKNAHLLMIVISIHELSCFFEEIDSLIELLNWSLKKSPQIKDYTIIYTFLPYKIVRKNGQDRGFAKFHSTPKN